MNRLGREGLVIGGKSMGGRIASLVPEEAGVAGLICLGYPFHPVGKPDRVPVEHLRTINTPTLLVQGERDPFGSREEVAGWLANPEGKKPPGRKPLLQKELGNHGENRHGCCRGNES